MASSNMACLDWTKSPRSELILAMRALLSAAIDALNFSWNLVSAWAWEAEFANDFVLMLTTKSGQRRGQAKSARQARGSLCCLGLTLNGGSSSASALGHLLCSAQETLRNSNLSLGKCLQLSLLLSDGLKKGIHGTLGFKSSRFSSLSRSRAVA